MKKTLIFLFLTLLFNWTLGQVKNPVDDGRKIRIPVVIHVIYNNEVQNISDDLILNELRDLNLDFSATNNMSLLDQYFKNIVGNPNIEFYLLDTVFQENGTKGIQRISTDNNPNRSAILVNPQNCLNVFIADQGNVTPTVGGDRVNLNYRDVGTHSHVLTHETGHWLGLYHIFGQIGSDSFLNVLLGNHDDLIDDTPPQHQATAVCYTINSGCPCPPRNIYYKGHKTLYNNFMDYDPCRCMFTIGQSIKMRDEIIKNRPALFKIQ